MWHKNRYLWIKFLLFFLILDSNLAHSQNDFDKVSVCLMPEGTKVWKPDSIWYYYDNPKNLFTVYCFKEILINRDSFKYEFYSEKEDFIYLFTGNLSEERIDVENEVVWLGNEQKNWRSFIKKSCNKNEMPSCISLLVEKYNSGNKKYYILNDTTQTINFIRVSTNNVLEYRNVFRVVSSGINVVCPDRVDGNLISKIKKSLKEKNFYQGSIDGIDSPSFRYALEKFQKINHLTVGHFDCETLKLLSVSFPKETILGTKDDPSIAPSRGKTYYKNGSRKITICDE
jgi:hypothetical protein